MPGFTDAAQYAISSQCDWDQVAAVATLLTVC